MIGQVLRLKREPDNCKDKYAVAIVLEDCVVGHVPYNLAKCMLSSWPRTCSVPGQVHAQCTIWPSAYSVPVKGSKQRFCKSNRQQSHQQDMD